MAHSFHRVNRVLRADHGLRSAAVLLIAILLLGSWIAWAFTARIARYAASQSAHLAIDLSPSAAGKLRVLAQFAPETAWGKVRVGEPAIVRLRGLPNGEDTSLSARVTRVGSALADGKVRVELAIASGPPSDLSFRNGWPASVDVEVERLSPAALIFRSAGAR